MKLIKKPMKSALTPRIVFMGTPEFAASILKSLISGDFAPVAVYTNPDRSVGRSKEILPTPVKLVAQDHQIPLYQPARLRDTRVPVPVIEELRALRPDLIVVASYGHILPKSIIDLPKYQTLNVHASLLPELRGASPIHTAILQGKSVTGVTIMKMDASLDTGDMLTQEQVPIEPRETYSTLHDKLALAGARLLLRTIPLWLEGKIAPQKQDESQATVTKILTKLNGKIDWAGSAIHIDRQIRAFEVWPQSFTFTPDQKRLFILVAEAETAQKNDNNHVPGKIIFSGDTLSIVAGKNTALLVQKLQLEGRQPLSAQEFMRGYRQFDGMVLS